MKHLLVIITALLSIGLPAVSSAELVDINSQQLEALVAEGVPVIDVRRSSEWKNTGIIEGSHLITFFDKQGNYDAEQWMNELALQINVQEPFVLICQTGVRSLAVGAWLGIEFDTVYNVQEGIASFIKDGHQVAPIPEQQ